MEYLRHRNKTGFTPLEVLTKQTRNTTREPLTGFTLIEMLAVMAIIIVIAGISFFPISYIIKRGYDLQRIQYLDTVKKALALYYTQNGHYPAPDTCDMNGIVPLKTGSYKFSLNNCVSFMDDGQLQANLRWNDTLTNPGTSHFMDSLIPEDALKTKYISASLHDWQDPYYTDGDAKYHCRYIIPKTTTMAAGSCNSSNPMEIQNYYMYCRLEVLTDAAKNDGGTNPNLYEIFAPNPWLCVQDAP
jgi:prepilin-type N-terminal cleavage/methylation domain-containing protein